MSDGKSDGKTNEPKKKKAFLVLPVEMPKEVINSDPRTSSVQSYNWIIAEMCLIWLVSLA